VLLPTFAILSQTQLVIEVAQASRGDLFARRHSPSRCWPTLDIVDAREKVAAAKENLSQDKTSMDALQGSRFVNLQLPFSEPAPLHVSLAIVFKHIRRSDDSRVAGLCFAEAADYVNAELVAGKIPCLPVSAMNE
jgi:hypothetical protein